MRLWIALHLPQLVLEIFHPRWSPDDARVAVLERDRVVARSRAAARAGIAHGMRGNGARLLAHDVVCHVREPAREQAALRDVALAVLRYTPQVALAEEATVLLDVSASLTLFGGPHALCAHLRGTLRALGYSHVIACAPTARAAWLLARAAPPRRLLAPRKTARRLDMLALALLPPARPFLDWFDGIACVRLGDLRRLPRPGLLRRCGPELLREADRAYGAAPEAAWSWLEAPLRFEGRLELFGRIEHAPALLAGAQRLLEQMTGWLCARQLAVTRVALAFEHERGRVARPPTPLELCVAQAVRDSEHLLRLLREKLNALELPAPVIGVALAACDVAPLASPSGSLFPEPGGTPADRARLFDLLAARLGEANVLRPVPRADYRPEAANVWTPALQGAAGACAGAGAAPRPAWLLAEPAPLALRGEQLWHGGALRIVSPPERIETGWWDAPCARDYFVAADRHHALYWIYRERGGDGARWFLHGLFA